MEKNWTIWTIKGKHLTYFFERNPLKTQLLISMKTLSNIMQTYKIRLTNNAANYLRTQDDLKVFFMICRTPHISALLQYQWVGEYKIIKLIKKYWIIQKYCPIKFTCVSIKSGKWYNSWKDQTICISCSTLRLIMV